MIQVLRWGGGVNSTAMAVGMHERGERPDFVVFSDTGDEKPETYAYLDVFRAWMARVGFPELVVVRYQTEAGDTTLEGYCLRVSDLPSRVYGSGACAEKWKIRPMEKWSTHEPIISALRKSGGKPVALVGYDADEDRRNKITENKRWTFRAPLIDWGWTREDCVAAIERAGLPVPQKSACFYCPASKKPEILELARRHPELMARALAMEDAAIASGNLSSVKGLARNYAWRDFLSAPAQPADQQMSFPEAPVEPCIICADGADDDAASPVEGGKPTTKPGEP